MADSTSGDPPYTHVIRCAECHEFVPAGRVRYREERIKVASAPAPGRWRAGGPPIFRASTHGPRSAPGTGGHAQAAPPPPQNAYAIEQIPVCVDCLQRQRMGIYGVCGIAAVSLLVAVAFYSHEALPPSSPQIALAPTDGPSPTSSIAATPKPDAPTAGSPAAPPSEGEGGNAPPLWRPIWEAATRLFASSIIPALTPVPTPEPDAVPPSAGIASASPPAPAAAPTPPPAPVASDLAPSASAPSDDIAGATSSAPPIWATERKPPRKVAKAAPATRRDEPAANAVALRNSGYVALGQRRYGEALTLFQQATMMGDAYAPMYIGQLYENGTGVPRNVGQASYWYGIAINRGNDTALVAFNRMRMSPY